MFQASYFVGVSLKNCNWFPHEFGDNASKPDFFSNTLVMQPDCLSTTTRRAALSSVIDVPESFATASLAFAFAAPRPLLSQTTLYPSAGTFNTWSFTSAAPVPAS